MAISNTLIGATQPVLTRYAAVRLDPILFCAAVTTIAAMCALPILYRRGELARLLDRRYAGWLIAMSMTGTVMTSITLIYGMQHIDAIATVILLETEPVANGIAGVHQQSNS